MRTEIPRLIAIYGCGGHARSAADVIIATGGQVACFYDEHARDGESIFGVPCLRDVGVFARHQYWHIALGDYVQRDMAAQIVLAAGAQIVTVRATTAHIGQEAVLGPGGFVGQAAHVGPLADIGALSIINTGAVVEHEVRVGRLSHVSINAVLAGRSEVGSRVFVGAAAVVRDGVSVCDGVTIGAGSVVVADIAESGIYVGVPARRLIVK